MGSFDDGVFTIIREKLVVLTLAVRSCCWQ
ncbi:unnamed protein product [Nezara viridula]|uniref:Uncharacterized protein n=1 Tax=Nezara viridula TaxID=85310 RepID=A0A9P0HJ94_NEZVI|nr:unnamed protein product [Nezara viridula]